MIVGIFIVIYMFLNILFFVKNHKTISDLRNQSENEYLNVRRQLNDFKKKNFLSILFSSLITIMIFTLPASLIVIFYMQFPVAMVMGQFNLILTYIGLMSIIIVFDLMRIKILNGYIEEASQKGTEINRLSIKPNVICNLLNPLNSGLYAVLVIVMMILLK